MKIIVVGGGPAGLLAAHGLVQRNGYEVHVYEKRSDMRKEDPASLRTYPIGLQERGLKAVEPGLRKAMEDAGKWIRGVALQGKSPKKMARAPSLYLDRNLIVYTILKYMEENEDAKGKDSSLHLHFETTLEDMELDDKTIFVRDKDGNGENVPFDGLIAADGANSIIRRWMSEEGEIKVLEESIPNRYLTFGIPLKSHDGTLELDDDRVHGWMLGGGKTVLMVPNKNGYATGVLIFPSDDNPIRGKKKSHEIKDYFQEISPESLGHFIGTEEAQALIDSPINYAKTAKCDKLHAGDCVLFIGDSAHAVSASMGQACNCALQDIEKFMEFLDEANDDWYRSLLAFSTRRMTDVHALHELSDYALPNPHDKWLQTEFVLRAVSKKIMPKFLTKNMKPLPNELLSTTDLSYSEILDQTEWWTSKVKKSLEKNGSRNAAA